MKTLFNIIMRIVAVFTASALGVIGAGAIAGISTIKAMSVAGITAVAAVVEKLARGFMNDGRLDVDEINAAFAAIDTKAKTAADLQVEARQSGQNIVVSADGAITQTAPAVVEQPVAVSSEDAEKAKDPNYN